MPLYEYQCERCDHRFEKIQKFSDPPVDTCPKCGSPVRKLISSPAIQFKGSGFYITDYGKAGSDSGSKGKSSAGESSGKGESKTESKSESKSDAQSGAKSDSKPAASTSSAKPE